VNVVIRTEAPPIRQDTSGTLRVGDSRVLLELVIQEFQDGATPKMIVQQYDTLALPDVYAAIGYYLRHRAEIQAYLDQRELRRKNGQASCSTCLAERQRPNESRNQRIAGPDSGVDITPMPHAQHSTTGHSLARNSLAPQICVFSDLAHATCRICGSGAYLPGCAAYNGLGGLEHAVRIRVNGRN
jgi:uncharacterized protein (DUF433 family)